MSEKPFEHDLLIHITTPPTLDLEPVELGMACAAFDQRVVFVFSGEGIDWLQAGQQAKRPQGKSADKLIKALAMYDCEDVYYLASGVEDVAGFVKNVRPVSSSELSKLKHSSKHQLNF